MTRFERILITLKKPVKKKEPKKEPFVKQDFFDPRCSCILKALDQKYGAALNPDQTLTQQFSQTAKTFKKYSSNETLSKQCNFINKEPIVLGFYLKKGDPKWRMSTFNLKNRTFLKTTVAVVFRVGADQIWSTHAFSTQVGFTCSTLDLSSIMGDSIGVVLFSVLNDYNCARNAIIDRLASSDTDFFQSKVK